MSCFKRAIERGAVRDWCAGWLAFWVTSWIASSSGPYWTSAAWKRMESFREPEKTLWKWRAVEAKLRTSWIEAQDSKTCSRSSLARLSKCMVKMELKFIFFIV